MAWEMGTANGYKDLLKKVHDLALLNGWTVERYTTDPAGFDELILSTTGRSGQEFYTVGFKTEEDPAADRYNVKIMSAVVYANTLTFEDQPQRTNLQYLYLWQNSIPYLIALDSGHIRIAAAVSNSFHVCYLGAPLAYASLGHWPQRNGCFGEGTAANADWRTQSDALSTLQYWRNDARQIYWIDDTYITPSLVFPSMYNCALSKCGNFTDHISLYPLMLAATSSDSAKNHGMLGEFAGCYYLSGSGISAWTMIQNGGRQFLAVPNVFRNGQNDFMALELI
uniref:hypothetical protein n=1 Tax=Thaumasiovibrio occultus TaxID=1891184 RepID=UPI000B359006|nr:hypothetical protein [Thaumasiovibrio occultus]